MSYEDIRTVAIIYVDSDDLHLHHNIPLGFRAGQSCENAEDFELNYEQTSGRLDIVCRDCDLVVATFRRLEVEGIGKKVAHQFNHDHRVIFDETKQQRSDANGN